MSPEVSIIIPAKNEAPGLSRLLPVLVSRYPDFEIIVVNDGSEDNTLEICNSYTVTVVNHPHSLGNGAALKAGVRNAAGNVLVVMDADGQHSPDDLQRLLDRLSQGYDMVVGARKITTHAGVLRLVGNLFYNWLASWMTGHRILDLTSGFRAIQASRIREFIHILPNGFSSPTTITMALFRAGYSVDYLSIEAREREGKSHIRIVRDGMRFLAIIFRVTAFYSPLKLFLPASAMFFITGVGYYIYTYATSGRFTNMGVLLLMTSVLVFLIGLVSEQITYLIYLERKK